MTYTWTFHLNWYDAYMAAVGLLLIVSFRIAVRSRDVATTNDRRSQRLMLWSGVLLAVGHGIFFGIGTMLSLEGFYLLNVAFMYNGVEVAVRMARRLRKQRGTAVPAPAISPSVDSPEPVAEDAPPARPEARHSTNGHRLPAQRPAPTGSGPWPRPQTPPTSAALAEPAKTVSLLPQDRQDNPLPKQVAT